ncbi:hypothetical protein [Nonomuraea sediminis]|uniref:hypothetical protein n=1 Tax=Nonomuraea sediminis TaxID=2835864 RepID=UPI001BDD6CB8|nr:hypothetical protein [Nonomuraea sediminis]
MTSNDPNRDWFAPPPGQPEQEPPAGQTPPPAQPPAPGQAPQPGPAPQPGQGAPQPPRRPRTRRSQRRQARPAQPPQQGLSPFEDTIPYGGQPAPPYQPHHGGQPPQGGQPPYEPHGGQTGHHQLPEFPKPRRAKPSVRPDQQVWPPARSEPAITSTQPIPAVPSAGPLPMTPPAPPPAPPVMPPPAVPQQQEQAPRRSRTVLLGVAAVAAFVAAVGVPTFDRYLFYKGGQPDDIEHVVQAGQAFAFEHVSWKVSVAPTTPAPGTPNVMPDKKQYLRITITRSAKDADGSVLTAKPEVSLQDASGRTWKADSLEDNVPPEKNPVGQEFSYVMQAAVPKEVAATVQVHLRPDTTYRNDTPVDKLLEIKPEDEEKSKHKDVLVFRR